MEDGHPVIVNHPELRRVIHRKKGQIDLFEILQQGGAVMREVELADQDRTFATSGRSCATGKRSKSLSRSSPPGRASDPVIAALTISGCRAIASSRICLDSSFMHRICHCTTV